MTPEEADAALTEWVKSLPHWPPRRTYVLEFMNGEWFFRRDEFDLLFDDAMEKAFGRNPDNQDDRHYGFKLP